VEARAPSTPRGPCVRVSLHCHTLQEPGGGHHSPIAAYNAQADAALVLDVSRYK